jgi:ferredoxin-NADP reductase
MLAMLHALHDRRSTRVIWWVHGARSRAEHAFADEAMSLLADLADGHRRIYYSRPGTTDRAETDYDEVGRVTPQALQAAGVPLDGEFYLCGPTVFMDSLRDGLLGFGVPAARVHTEIFGAHDALTPGVLAHPTRPPHRPDGTPGTGPMVTFVRSGLEVPWRDDAAHLLELAEACDVPVRWSCRTGVCHNCETGLVDGTVEYDPEPLEMPAEGNLLLCCARPTADLTIDL